LRTRIGSTRWFGEALQNACSVGCTLNIAEEVLGGASPLGDINKRCGGQSSSRPVIRPPAPARRRAHEVKWDGYRAQAHLRDGKAVVFSRNGNDWSEEFAPIAAAVAHLKACSAILDGEAVVLDKDGRSDFGALRAELNGKSRRLRYCVFDLLELDGTDLRPLPLAERRAHRSHLRVGIVCCRIDARCDNLAGIDRMLAATQQIVGKKQE